MFGLFKKKVEVLDHWIAFVDGFYVTPAEYYATLEKELAERKMPSMDVERLELPEGGLLSRNRTYLRMVRERLVFDVCAAPFGDGFFFSCRTAEKPLLLKLEQVFALFLIIGFGLWATTKLFGFFLGIIVLVATLGGLGYVLRNAVAMGLHDLDKALMNSPVIGSIYEIYFRKETYHRIDSRLCYLNLVPAIVKSVAEDATLEKGVKLVRQYHLCPIFGELYKPAPMTGQVPLALMPEPAL